MFLNNLNPTGGSDEFAGVLLNLKFKIRHNSEESVAASSLLVC